MESTPHPCDEALDAKKNAEEIIIYLLLETSLYIEKLKTDLEKVKQEGRLINLFSKLFLRDGIVECGDYTNKIADVEREMRKEGCQNFPPLCPILYAEYISLSAQGAASVPCLQRLDKAHEANFREKIKENQRKYIEIDKAIKDGDSFTKKNKEEIDKTQAELDDINKYIQDNCSKKYKDFIENTSHVKSKKCNKTKEKIKKLKNQYFKLSKDMLGIQYGISGIKFNKLQQKNLIESKPIIEEAIKKIGDLKRYVIGTEDEAQFFTIHSKVKSMLAQNIKEQSVVEDNLKNLLVKKEKTNKIIKTTKKVLNHKIKQSIKLCN
jgi:hypothetical protein